MIEPNIIFQNARISWMAPPPERLPPSQWLPRVIYFFVRVSSQDGHVSLVKPLPERIKKLMHHATIQPGRESAGPKCRLEFDGKTVIGLGTFLLVDSLQLVIEVPSCEAFSEQDPCVEPTSLTFQPYRPSSRHGEWDPRIIVPIRMGPARIPCGPSRPKLPLLTGSEVIGNPYADSPSRGHLNSEHRLSRSNERLPSSRLTPRQERPPPATAVQHNAEALRTPKHEGSPPSRRGDAFEQL